MEPADLIIRGGHLATMRPEIDEPYGAIEDGLIIIKNGAIAWIGPERDAPTLAGEGVEIDLEGGWATPGLIDCHTHLVFAGQRADEFERRLEGASYEEIARAGGGILSSVRATRAASDGELERVSAPRLAALVDHGCTTVEIKSGYGLDVDTELRQLRVGRTLGVEADVTVSTTLLGAHALPGEYQGDREAYLDLLVRELIPAAVAAGVADAVDAFCEGIAFTVDECRRVLSAGADLGLGVRIHADQLSDSGGASLAASLGARSADHVEYTSVAGAAAMAAAGTTAVVLPGAFYFLRETQLPPIDDFRRFGVPIAIGTDLNPGSSPVTSPLLALNMACVLFRLTPEEALAGMTRLAAPVLGFPDRGVLQVGARADIACWHVNRPGELSYWIGGNPCAALVSGGTRIR